MPFGQIVGIDLGQLRCGGHRTGQRAGRQRAKGVDRQRAAAKGVVLAGERVEMRRHKAGHRRHRRRFGLELRIGEHPRHILADDDEHAFEQRKGFRLIFIERRLLRIGTQVDDLAQRIKRRQMLLPVMIERLEQEVLFDLHPGFGRYAGGLFGHRGIGGGDQPVDNDFGVDRSFGRPVAYGQIERQRAAHGFIECFDIPLFGVAARRAVRRDDGVDGFVAHVDDDIADGFGIHDVGALFVNDLALVIHDIVILEQLLAHVVIARLDLLLRRLDRLGNPRVDDRLAIFETIVHHAAEHRLLAEDAQQIIIEAEVKTAEPGIALTARATAQLVVDTAAFMAFGAEHEQPTGSAHGLALGLHFLLDALDGGVAFRAFGHVAEFARHPRFEIAAKLDIGAAAGHVGGDGDGTQPAGLFDDMRFLFVETGVEHDMLDILALQEFAEHLALFDRHGAHQNRLVARRRFADGLDDRLVLLIGILVEFVIDILARHRLIGRDFNDIQLVDIEEFRCLGGGGSGHAAQLGVHAEIILEGHARQRLVLGLDLDAFLGLHRLVQTVGPAPAIHHAAGEFIDDDHLAAAHDVIGIAAIDDIGAQCLVEMVDDLGIFKIVEVFTLQQTGGRERAFGLFGAVFGEDNRFGLFIDFIVAGHQFLHHDVDRHVHFRLVVGGAGNDQRGARFIDQHRIDFIDDGEMERPLHHLLAAVFHIVAEIVEAEFIVGAIGDVGGIGFAAGVIVDIGHDDTDAEPEEFIDLAHPAGIARRQIIIDRHNMDALAGQRIEIDSERGDEGLAFAGTHFGDFSAVKHHPADQLHIEMAHPHGAPGGLADGRKGFGQNVIERLAGGEFALQLVGLAPQRVIGQGRHHGFERIDARDKGRQRLDVAIVARAEQPLGDTAESEHENPDALGRGGHKAPPLSNRRDVGSATCFVNSTDDDKRVTDARRAEGANPSDRPGNDEPVARNSPTGDGTPLPQGGKGALTG